MGGDLKSDFKQLVEQYEAEKEICPGNADNLLDELLDKLYDEAADFWYSSSANC